MFSEAVGRQTRKIGARAGHSFSTLQWWLLPQGDPSFLLSYQRHRRNYTQALQHLGRPWGSLWPWESKDGSRLLADRLGVSTPQLFQGPRPISEVDWTSLPGAFVVKPTRGAGKAGVFLVQREGSHLRDLIRGGATTSADIVQHISAASLKGEVSGDSVIVEEALLSPNGQGVNDWKCYAFQGEVLLVWQIARSPDQRRSKYYDDQWRHLGSVRHRTPVDPALMQPQLPSELIAAAQRVSLALPVPFVRVDLYEHGNRVLLGEVTPIPGSRQRFRRDLDRRMGEAWERAEARLLARGASAQIEVNPDTCGDSDCAFGR